MLIAWIVFLPFAGAFISYLIGRKNEALQDRINILMVLAVLVMTCCLPKTMPRLSIGGVFAYGLTFTTDGFRAAYAIVTAIMWMGTTLFSPEYFLHEREGLNRYWFFVLATFGATEGVMLSGDIMTSFVFFEILSFTSFTWVIHEETKEAIRAGYTYLFIAIIGGLVLFMGLLLLRDVAGTLSFAELYEACKAAVASSQSAHGELLAAGFCILFGFGCKAGMFPVHVWLPKAHPVAPSPGSALLSGILTKVGIYGILMTSMTALPADSVFGLTILTLGVITMFLGAVLALFSINLKRTLACSSMSQIGFILTGVGMYILSNAASGEEAAETALSGLMLHMTNHSLIKLTLFMAAGVVVMNLHTLTLDDIRGWGRKKWPLKVAFGLGALGISGVPFFNGYISKTLLHEGIVEGIHVSHAYAGYLHVVEWIFLVSGGCTFAYMLKLFICVFVEKNKSAERQAAYDAKPCCMNRLSTATICGSSIAMVILGVPAVSKRLAAFMTGSEEILRFSAFTLENLKGGFISLGIGALLYLFFVRKVLLRNGSYVNLWPAKLDLEELVYRPVLTRYLPDFFGQVAAVFGENKILIPVAKGILFLGSFLGRCLADSTDGLIRLLRGTVLHEERVKTSGRRAGVLTEVREATEVALKPLTENFSFALLMTCVGMLLILGVLVALVVL